ncbi:MAG TPA: NAD(P)/FAD-dependent oxidoreductase [Actinomycetota bacterium]|nr:NAD(P)/FAD-dependent oxidoreductase [Actinomycetota bacterium]
MDPASGSRVTSNENLNNGHSPSTVVILGAGPAGLTAAWELVHSGVDVEVLEADPEKVGGIARTASYKDFRFDIGGHRFFTKASEVTKLWHEILPPEDWRTVPRLSRIYYRGKFFAYPLKPFDALTKLGIFKTAACMLSYAKAKLFPRKQEKSLEDWVINRFGVMLYRIFFKTYTEKVWGIPCDKISADWAAQRIKGLSLTKAVRAAFTRQGKKSDGEVIKTLIEEFEYPRLGPGMMWESAAGQIGRKGGRVRMGSPVTALYHRDGALQEVEYSSGGRSYRVDGSHFISTLPIRDLVGMLQPPAPAEVVEAAQSLSYRDFLTVVLVVDRPELFPDNWIYIHDPSVRLGRIQNFKNWSPEMVPDLSKSSLGLEYFCTEGDGLWEMPDEDLIALGKREVDKLGLAQADEVLDGTVVRMRKAYPVYDEHYESNVAVVRNYLQEVMPNLQLVGRNGMHKYNNQDHSMMTALLAARNILGASWDPWKVNTDAEYHEEVQANHDTAGRMVPQPIT